MLTRSSKFLFAAVLAGALMVGPVRVTAQEAAAAPSGQNWKDRAEYDLFDSIQKDATPQSRLDKLNQWKDKYPQTDFSKQRAQLFLTTYAQLNQAPKALDAAKDVLASDPADFTGLYYTMLLTPQLPSATPDQVETANKAANSLLNGGLDAQFAKDKKPATVTDAQWTQARAGVEEAAHTSLAWVDIQQKHDDQADAEYEKALTVNPGDINLVYGTLGKRLYGEKKHVPAIFYYTRAGAYDGPGALDAGVRPKVLEYAKKLYINYHGSAEGFEDVVAKAKTSATVPADLKIVSGIDRAKEDEAKAQQLARDNPGLAIWLNVKASLTAPDGATYFASNMKDTLVPGLSGKVVSMEPAVRPKTVVLAIEDGTTPDATLQFDAPLAGKVEPGTVLKFDGTPVSFAASPYMVTFKVEKDHLKGWTGTGGAPGPVRRPAHK